MLPKAQRATAQDFKGLKTRLHYRGAFFDLSVAPADTPKMACIISKKRIKRAVDRNRAKRKVYALVREVSPLPVQLTLIYPTKNILQAPHPTLLEEIKKAFATL